MVDRSTGQRTIKDGGMLVSDFDGTMTRYDFYDLVCQAFPQISAAGHWQQYEAGQITHFEALRRIFAEIRADERQLLDIIERMEIDPQLTGSVAALERAGWSVSVASAGCDWYIKKLLAGAGVNIQVHANPGEFSAGEGLLMRLPAGSPFCSPDLGVNKMAVVRDALARSSRVAFAGDGRPDLAPALLVRPERRFARSWLAKKLHELGEGYQPFERWSDIVPKLLHGERP